MPINHTQKERRELPLWVFFNQGLYRTISTRQEPAHILPNDTTRTSLYSASYSPPLQSY